LIVRGTVCAADVPLCAKRERRAGPGRPRQMEERGVDLP